MGFYFSKRLLVDLQSGDRGLYIKRWHYFCLSLIICPDVIEPINVFSLMKKCISEKNYTDYGLIIF